VTFGGGGLDRAAGFRTDPKACAEARRTGRFILLWRGKPLVGEAGLALLEPARLPPESGEEAFLGLVGGQPVFAADLSAWQPGSCPAELERLTDTTEQRHPALGEAGAFMELRQVMTLLTPVEGELAATARGLFDWHRSHGFCARCGAPSALSHAGWQRLCASCGRHHFPRTDPVAIMLVTRGNSVLLGRSPGWPDGMFSLLAGFVEPGETVEAAVRRETFEEAGIEIGRVRYLASQPWPFPASLMIGCHAEALTRVITRDPSELEDARWLTREEVAMAFRGALFGVRAARRGAIAHFLLHRWLSDRLD
jgi:NAD+ diphosphatase